MVAQIYTSGLDVTGTDGLELARLMSVGAGAVDMRYGPVLSTWDGVAIRSRAARLPR